MNNIFGLFSKVVSCIFRLSHCIKYCLIVINHRHGDSNGPTFGYNSLKNYVMTTKHSKYEGFHTYERTINNINFNLELFVVINML